MNHRDLTDFDKPHVLYISRGNKPEYLTPTGDWSYHSYEALLLWNQEDINDAQSVANNQGQRAHLTEATWERTSEPLPYVDIGDWF